MFTTLKDHVNQLAEKARGLSIDEFLLALIIEYPEQVTFSTSFSFEDQVIAHKILNNQLPINIFTLDTGRIFPETYSVWNA
ncbi:MAG: phosphoadenylyl-sulfate reductase, partial [Ginsengibacter sp.]